MKRNQIHSLNEVTNIKMNHHENGDIAQQIVFQQNTQNEKKIEIVNNTQEKIIKEQTISNQKKCNFELTKPKKIILGITVGLLIVLIIGLSIGLSLHLKPKASVKSKIGYIMGSDGNFVSISKLQYTDINIVEPNVNITVSRASLLNSSNPSQELNYLNNINFEDQGVVAKMTNNSEVGFVIDPSKLIQYAIAQQPSNSRLLQSLEASNELNSTTNITQTHKQQLQALRVAISSYLSTAFNTSEPIPVSFAQFEQYRYNDETKTFQLKQNTTKILNRLLLRRQLGFFDFLDQLINSVLKVFDTVLTNTLKKLINPTAGEVIGALTGAFISAGFREVKFLTAVSYGMRIGRAAESFIMNCHPQTNGIDINCLVESTLSPYISFTGTMKKWASHIETALVALLFLLCLFFVN